MTLDNSIYFENDQIKKVNNGLLNLCHYYDGFTDIEPFDFTEILDSFFLKYCTDYSFRNNSNRDFLLELADIALNFQYLIDKEKVFRLEGTINEPAYFDDFMGIYCAFYNIGQKINTYFEEISPELFQEIKLNVFHAIDDVINKIEISKESISIGAEIDLSNYKRDQPKQVSKKIPEKWYALHYWFELAAHGKKSPIDLDGAFIKKELVEIGAQRCNSKGQAFYREFKNIDINNPLLIKNEFGKDWKEKIIELFGNDVITIDYINKYYS